MHYGYNYIKKKKPIKKVKFLITASIVIILFVSFILLANNWRDTKECDKITVTGNYSIPSENILQAGKLINLHKINLDEINITYIQDEIMKIPEVKKVFISIEPPSELKIEIVEKKPLAIINTGKGLKLIDEEMEIYSSGSSERLSELPLITGIKFDSTGLKVSGADIGYLKKAVNLITSSCKLGKYTQCIISEVNMNDDSKIVVYSTDEAIPFYLHPAGNTDFNDTLYQNNLNKKLVIMKNFFEKFRYNLSNTKIEYVDLRYENEIIVKYN